MDYTIIRLDEERIKDLDALFAASGKTSSSFEKFRKKYDTAYTGKRFIGYLAYAENGDPAAFYGVLPVVCALKGERFVIAQSADTITHPEHQRKGLFVQLAQKTYALAKEEGIHFLYGIPNSNSYPGFVGKLGWSHNSDTNRYQIPVSNLPFGALFKKYKLTKKLHQRYANFIFARYRFEAKELEIKTNEYQVFIPRNEEYVNYKSYLPKHFISVSGIRFWVSMDGSFKIGDFEDPGNTDRKKLIRKLKRIGFWLGTHKIVFECSPGSEKNAFFEGIVPAVKGSPIIYLNLSEQYDPEKLVLTLADVDTF